MKSMKSALYFGERINSHCFLKAMTVNFDRIEDELVDFVFALRVRTRISTHTPIIPPHTKTDGVKLILVGCRINTRLYRNKYGCDSIFQLYFKSKINNKTNNNNCPWELINNNSID